ncbi:hypothetical protein BV898_06635 [Hypsibius exemplaris]|uniref:Transmembrane protein n=1 Tax=Hypsibius exemplaris TaxID=2072580 RepID=A0A1W0WW26_HYPEX|nr:hypothetical protein BV898_06635 [Hypsibius exemplaris]
MKKINGSNPLDIGRNYRWSQHSTRRTFSTGDPSVKIRSIFVCLCGTSLACIIAIILQAVSLSGSYWGHYDFVEHGALLESGHFGLWTVCIENVAHPGIWDCGLEQPGRRLSVPAWCAISGICGVLSICCLGACLLVALLQLLRIGQGEPTWCANRRALSQKVIPAIFAVLLSSACVIFAALAMIRIRSAKVTYGTSFWIQVAAISFNVIVLICTAIESFWRPYPTPPRPLEAKPEETAQLKPKQSFFPLPAAAGTSREPVVVMNPRGEQDDDKSSGGGAQYAAPKEKPSRFKAVLRRSVSEGANGSAKILRQT